MTTRVWDPLVRLSHWGIALGVLVAYVSADDSSTIHGGAGYLVGGLVGLRVIWGFVGAAHARFANFLYPPAEVARYLTELAEFRARRYVGHSPGGGVMALVLLGVLLAAVLSGVWTLAISNRQDLLAVAASSESSGVSNQAVRGDAAMSIESRDTIPSEDVHAAIANLALVLIVMHVLSVLLVSMIHKENLTKSMLTGFKRDDTGEP